MGAGAAGAALKAVKAARSERPIWVLGLDTSLDRGSQGNRVVRGLPQLMRDLRTLPVTNGKDDSFAPYDWG